MNNKEMVITEVIGKRIEECMKERGETYTELAKRIGVTRQTMYSYLTGTSMINVLKLDLIAKHYGKDFNYFWKTENIIGMDFNVETNLDLQEFNYRFIQWVESNGWRCGGEMFYTDIYGNKLPAKKE